MFDVQTVPRTSPAERPIYTRGKISEKVQETVIKATEIAADQVQRNMAHFLSNIQGMLEKGDQVPGPYSLNTVEVEASISAEGKIGFMGTGVGLEGNASLKFIFTRVK